MNQRARSTSVRRCFPRNVHVSIFTFTRGTLSEILQKVTFEREFQPPLKQGGKLTEIRRNEGTSRYHGAVCRVRGQRFLGTSNGVRVSSGEVSLRFGEVGIISAAPEQGRRGGIIVPEYARHRHRPVYDQPTWMMPVTTIRVPETKRIGKLLN